MKKILFAVIISLTFVSFTNITKVNSSLLKEIHGKHDSVYICNSSTAYAYHSTINCRGLDRCTHGVIKVSLDDAVNKYGRRPCKECEKQ